MFLTHIVTVCDGMWAQVPGGGVPDDLMHVIEPLHARTSLL